MIIGGVRRHKMYHISLQSTKGKIHSLYRNRGMRGVENAVCSYIDITEDDMLGKHKHDLILREDLVSCSRNYTLE